MPKCVKTVSSWCSCDIYDVTFRIILIIIERKIPWNRRRKVLLCYLINYLFSLHSAEVNWMGFLQPSEKIEPGRCFSLPNYGDTKKTLENYFNTILVSKKLKRAFVILCHLILTKKIKAQILKLTLESTIKFCRTLMHYFMQIFSEKLPQWKL